MDAGKMGRLFLGLVFATVGFWLLVRANRIARDHGGYYWFYPMEESSVYPCALRFLGAACIPVGILLAIIGIPETDTNVFSSQHELLIAVPAYFAGIFFMVLGMGLWMHVDEVHAKYRRVFPFIPGVRTRFYRWQLRLYAAFLGFVGTAIAFGVLT